MVNASAIISSRTLSYAESKLDLAVGELRECVAHVLNLGQVLRSMHASSATADEMLDDVRAALITFEKNLQRLCDETSWLEPASGGPLLLERAEEFCRVLKTAVEVSPRPLKARGRLSLLHQFMSQSVPLRMLLVQVEYLAAAQAERALRLPLIELLSSRRADEADWPQSAVPVVVSGQPRDVFLPVRLTHRGFSLWFAHWSKRPKGLSLSFEMRAEGSVARVRPGLLGEATELIHLTKFPRALPAPVVVEAGLRPFGVEFLRNGEELVIPCLAPAKADS
ncbi:MAG: hypothetical protein MK135_01400 [Polyangiaceae bacterium]|nr:hypothetical protein [Polyangiaceae bacterium]